MIELSSSWELQGRLKLSDILFVKEVQLDNQSCDCEDNCCDLPTDASSESTSKPVILQPYLHPEVSSAGPCCIMIRLSTQRPLRIVKLVLISSSPHIDFVDRYGEPLARIEGVPMPNSGSLFRCSSGRLSPHTECVVRFSEVHHLDPLVIQHMGVYTSCSTCPLSVFAEPPESHTQEIIKISSFLGSSPRQPAASTKTDSQANHMRLSKFPSSTPMSCMESQRDKCTDSTTVISTEKEASASESSSLDALCSRFLTSLFGYEQAPPGFWRKCATSLFTSLVEIGVGELASERQTDAFFLHLQNVFEDVKNRQKRKECQEKGEDAEEEVEGDRQQVHLPDPANSRPTHSPNISALSHSCRRSDDSVVISICTLSASLNEIRQSITARLDEILKRLSNLEKVRKTAGLQQLSRSTHQQSL